jgi:hypothetical protein
MIQKPFACFGRVLIRNTYYDGEVIEVVIADTSAATLLCTSGSMTGVDLTGERTVTPVQTGDLITPEIHLAAPHHQSQTMHNNYIIWCYSPVINHGYQADIEKFQLDGGSETILPVGTKLFLCSGTLAVDGSNIAAPAQINIKSTNQLVQAMEACLGMIFA